MALRKSAVLFLCVCTIMADVCPRQCDCDSDNGLNRATCVDQNIISIDVGVPKAVQVYVLSHNAISELNNQCFQEVGYISLEVLDLSYNRIFWIGIHAFIGLDKLVHLDLSYNRLRSFPPDLFWDTPQLDTLDLSWNVFEKLKNEPFILHANLKVLNLNNCRIRSLPTRLFTRLPNLRKLDLSENYMVTLPTEALVPLRKLERLELRNVYWQCNTDFKAIESWILSKGIQYKKQCTEGGPKMSEKMISAIPETDRKEVDLTEIWNTTDNVTLPDQDRKPITPFEKFDKEFSSLQALVIGLEVGLAIGVVGTYIWLSRFCHCGRLNCIRPSGRRQRRRRTPRTEGDMRTNLLWSNVVQPDSETPPLFRRQMPLPDRSPPYDLQGVTESALQVDAIRVPNRAETPPPPYNECRLNV